MKLNLATFLLIAVIMGFATLTRASDFETVTFAAPKLGGMKVNVNVILPREYREVPGGHKWPVWEGEIQRVLAFEAPVLGVEVECSQGAKREPDRVQRP